MAQVFQQDSQMLAAPVTIVTTAETTALSTNAVKAPFENAKMTVRFSALVTTGTGVTGVQVRVRRNAAAENVVLNPAVQTIGAAASATIAVSGEFTDGVPDGRDSVYSLTVQQVGATGNGTILAGSQIAAQVLSG